MRLKYIVFFWLVVSFFSGLAAYAIDQQPVARQYNFREYTLFDGLPQGQVTSIQQDDRGYIWLGSYGGITRFNGSEFETFSQPLASNTVRSITKTTDSTLLVGTAGGFCYLRFDQFDCRGQSDTLPFVNLFNIHIARDSSMWISSDNGVMHLTPEKTVTYTKQQGLPSATVRNVIEDKNGVIWAATDKGLVYLDNGQFKNFGDTHLNEVSARALLDTPEGIWVGAVNGLYFISHSTKQITKMDNDRFIGNGVLALFEDSRGILWIGTYRGLYRMVQGKLEKLSPQRGLKSVTTYTIVEDREGSIWIGSDSGLIKYVPGPFVTYTTEQGMSHDFVRAISVAKDGKVWMGTRDGVSIFNPEDESFQSLIKQLEQDQTRIYSIQNLPDESVLIGTQEGLIHWKHDRVVAHFSDEKSMPAKYVSAILIDQSEQVWIGTSHGLARWQDDQLVTVPQSEFTIGGIYSMRTDKQGRIWLGTGNQGIVVFDPVKSQYIKLAHIPEASEYTIWSIDRDKNGHMWIGTNGNGLLEINEEFELQNIFNESNGLKNNFIWQVMNDSRGNVWAFTNNGLKKYDGERFTHFEGSDGLPDLEGAATAVIEHPNGDLWFGTAFGVARYSPSEEETEVGAPPIIIESLNYDGRVIKDHEKLIYDKGAVVAKFASLSFKDERAIEFFYRLLGADDKWSAYQPNNSTQFSNLSPGDYEFQVKAISDRRVSSELPASFHFSILPPFWLTWWFITACFVLSFGLFAWMVYYRVKLISMERDRLELVVEERTTELTSTNAELMRLVTIDDLTQLHNRRHLIESLNYEIRRLTRCVNRTSLAFIILDVDHFKAINDTYGHTAGDRVLQELANRIKIGSRETDICARYGGEEFAIGLPLTDKAGALTCGEKIRKEIADRKFLITHQQEIDVTVSLGVSVLSSEGIALDENSDRIIREADAALYRAKERGRNQLCSYDPDTDVSI